MNNKKVFVINFSEDGLHYEAFTNIKAVFNFVEALKRQGSGYSPITIDYGEYSYSYSNMLKVSNKKREFKLDCNESSITITEVFVSSKL